MTVQGVSNLSDLLSFFLLLQYITVARRMLFFTINSLTSNLKKGLSLPFELNNFLGGSSEVVEVSEDLTFLESLYTFVDFLVRGQNIFSRLG